MRDGRRAIARARGVFFKAARGRKRCMEKEGGQGGGCVYEVISCQTQERHFYTLGERVVDKNTKISSLFHLVNT